MAKPVHLESFYWPTQNKALAFFTSIRDSYPVGEGVTYPDHILALQELLDVHPNKFHKIGPGIKRFFIDLTSKGDRFNVRSDAAGIWIEQVDGTKVDFGYTKLVTNPSRASIVKTALRLAVDDVRMRFRESRNVNGYISDLSGQSIPTRDQAHVIYSDPTWPQLTYSFAQLEGGWDCIELQSESGIQSIGTRLLNPDVTARWLAFHEKHAVLRLATSAEAASRPRSDETAWTPRD